jgi:hypothetical protein
MVTDTTQATLNVIQRLLVNLFIGQVLFMRAAASDLLSFRLWVILIPEAKAFTFSLSVSLMSAPASFKATFILPMAFRAGIANPYLVITPYRSSANLAWLRFRLIIISRIPACLVFWPTFRRAARWLANTILATLSQPPSANFASFNLTQLNDASFLVNFVSIWSMCNTK